MIENMQSKAKKTFLNLDLKRQEEILETAILEFVINDYQNASLSRIIKNIGLAKGSFYRYFNSKKDLYVYLLFYTTQYRFNEIDTLAADKKITLKDIIIENFRMKIEFDKKYPLYSGFSYRILRETSKEVGAVKSGLWHAVLEIIKKIIYQCTAQKGKTMVNINIAAFSILQIQLAIFEYLEFFHQVDFLDNIKNGKPIFSIDDDLLMQIVREFASVLTQGIIQ